MPSIAEPHKLEARDVGLLCIGSYYIPLVLNNYGVTFFVIPRHDFPGTGWNIDGVMAKETGIG